MSKSKKIFLKDGFNIYSAETGKKVDIVNVPKDAIMIIYTQQTYHQKRKKKTSGKYVYRLKSSKEWLIANELTTSFLREVVFDYYNTTAIVLDANRLSIAFFGDTQEYKTFPIDEIPEEKLEEEKKNFYESIFQGVLYKVVAIDEVLKLVETKPIWLYALPAGVLVVLGAVGYLIFGGGGNENLPPPTKNPFRVVKPQVRYSDSDIKITRTRELLRKLREVQENLKGWQYISQIDFGGGTIKVRSMLPDEGFKKINKVWYEKKIKVPLRVKPQKVDYSNWNECLAFFGDEKADIRANTKNSIKLSLREKDVSFRKVAQILTEIARCPVYITGTIKTKYPPKEMNLELEITLYKKRR